jgi:hypothetical protein
MSSRTAHSFGGMRRYIQVSRTQTFLFVEGRDLDPDVYGRICGQVCRDSGKTYEIVVADRIIGDGGGKGALIRFFEYLRDSGSLVDRSQTDAKLAMFYLDKDVDDIFQTLRASDHVVYTVHYCIENHMFAEGDLVSSLATAGSVDQGVIRPRVPNPVLWRSTSAVRWREWVALCILARKLSLRHPAGYSRSSSINVPADSATDAAGLAACVAQMEILSGLVPADFQRKLAAAYRLVDAIYRRAEHDLLFKGKWYWFFVLRELELAYPLFNRNGAQDRLWGSLIATVNFDEPWVQHFREPLRDALARL